MEIRDEIETMCMMRIPVHKSEGSTLGGGKKKKHHWLWRSLGGEGVDTNHQKDNAEKEKKGQVGGSTETYVPATIRRRPSFGKKQMGGKREERSRREAKLQNHRKEGHSRSQERTEKLTVGKKP